MSEAEGCVYFCLANFILAVVKLIFLGLSSGGQQLGTSQLRPQLLCLLPLQVGNGMMVELMDQMDNITT